jgi:glycosyltransferase involved in cell wall biosynthesis
MIENGEWRQLVGPCFLPLLVAWFLRKPVAIEHHGYPPVCPNGLLFYEPAKTVCPEALAQWMRTVLDHPEVIVRNGDVARRRALDFFSQRRMVKEYFDLYCQLAPAVNRGKKAQHLA